MSGANASRRGAIVDIEGTPEVSSDLEPAPVPCAGELGAAQLASAQQQKGTRAASTDAWHGVDHACRCDDLEAS